VCIVMASVFDFVALAFGPQSVIAPLGSLTMVSNTCVAPWMHNEKLHGKVVFATMVIVAGCVVAVASASHANDICSVEALFALYLTVRFAFYATILSSTVAGVLWFIRRAERIKADYGVDTEAYRKVFRYHRVSYAFLSGLFGAQSVLFARSVAQLFVGSTLGGRIFLAYPGTYVIIFCLVGCIVLQLYFLNLGLARFESMCLFCARITLPSKSEPQLTPLFLAHMQTTSPCLPAHLSSVSCWVVVFSTVSFRNLRCGRPYYSQWGS